MKYVADICRWALPCLLGMSASSWAAQPDPLNAQAHTPALEYQSPLSGYQPYSEPPLQNWREANDLVGRIGGWRTYAQEPWEAQPAESLDTEKQPAAQPMEHAHDHH